MRHGVTRRLIRIQAVCIWHFVPDCGAKGQKIASILFPGEPFNTEELEEMLSAAVDPDKGIIQYKEYVSIMSIEET